MRPIIRLFRNQTESAGDVVYPLRLLVAPDGMTLEVSANIGIDAGRIADALSSGGEPEQVLMPYLIPVLAGRGYAPLPRAEQAILHFVPAFPQKMPDCTGLVRLDDCPACGWALSHARCDLPACAWAVVADDHVIAAAWETEGEIAVETAPAWRRQGYGRAVVAALICSAQADGRNVHYRCARTNAASRALAESLGLGLTAREYHPGFRKLANEAKETEHA